MRIGSTSRRALALTLGLASCVVTNAEEWSSTTGGSTTGGSTRDALTEAAPDLPRFDCAPGEGEQLYEQRIAPLLQTDRPKTCNQCHLSGVELAAFVRPTPCQTMACLETRGLVDLETPEDSVILQWIARASPDSELITEAVIAEEYEGFLAWIEQAASCDACADVDVGEDPCGEGDAQEVCEFDDPEQGPAFDDPGDCSEHTREALFRHKVYAWRERCYPCHFDSSQVEAPKWITTGPCDLASLATLRTIQGGGLLDLDAPASSRLLLKPLAESAGGVEHGGHDKFASVEDPAYMDILDWIEREAACTP